MKTKAAVIHGLHQDWSVDDVEVHAPKAGEVLVNWKVAGLCHSDEHLVTGDMVPPQELLDMMGLESMFPMVGGHEGAGVILDVGPGVTSVKKGDHVSASFIPSCGRCRYCSTGRQNLCDLGAGAMIPGMITDGTHRHFLSNGTPVGMMAKVGTFSEVACVAEASVIKVDPDLPLESVALVSCGVATGWGSAANRAVKREKAMEMGATHTFSSMEEAMAPVMEMTWGQMADRVIMTPGVLHGEMMEMAQNLTGKGGTMVVTAISPMTSGTASINLFNLAMFNKEVKGTIFGSLNPRADIPKLLGMYRDGQLKLDELITKRYKLSQINEGYRAMRDGENIRGVIVND